MRGITFPGDGKVELLEVPDPTPGPGEVVLEMRASGMCGTDLGLINLAPGSRRHPLTPPDARANIAGHEPCGVVAALGSGVDPRRRRVGDRVMVHHYSGCGTCTACQSGWSQMCTVEQPYIYGTNADGGHAQYLKVPEHTLVPLPDEVSFVAGAGISCGTGTAYGALRRVRPSGTDTIVIFGQGPVGLAATQLASAMGARVIALDVSADRLARAAELGAEATVDPSQVDPVEAVRELTKGEGVPFAFDTSGVEAARTQAVNMLAPWGSLVLIAGVNALNVTDLRPIITNQLSILGSWTFSKAGQAECARFMADHGIDGDAVFTNRWRLEQGPEAYASFAARATGKGVFIP